MKRSDIPDISEETVQIDPRAMELAGLSESVSRHCAIYKAKDRKWYLELANKEYGEYEDSTTYGPFSSEDDAENYLRNFSNPGGLWTDNSGKRPKPKKSPNGRPVVRP